METEKNTPEKTSQPQRFNQFLATALSRLSDQFRDPLTAEQIHGWQSALQGMNPKYFAATVTELIKTQQFMPKPATFREAYNKVADNAPMVKLDCRQCGGSGWWMRPGKDTAERCKHGEFQ